MKFKLCTVLSLLFVLNLTNAQQRGGRQMPEQFKNMKGSVKGSVKEKDSKNAIEYANVALYRMRDSSLVTGGITNGRGEFVIPDVPLGRYYVIANFIGYNKEKVSNIKVTPRSTDVKIETIFLSQAFQQMDEVVVMSDRTQIEYKIDKKVVNVSSAITSAGGSAVEVLQNTPSIQTDIDGNVTLRGSSSFTVLIDGKPSVLSGSEALQQIPASAIENVEVITAPSAKYDPDGMAGIINVIMKKNKRLGINGIINASAASDESKNFDFLVNYKDRKVNYFAGFDYNDRRRPGEMTIDREYLYNSNNKLESIFSERDFAREGISAKAGFDYYITNNTSFGLSAEYGNKAYSRTMDQSNSSYFFDEVNKTAYNHSYSRPSSMSENDRDYYKASLNFNHDFEGKGHNLIFTGSYYNYSLNSTDNLITPYYNTDDYSGIIASRTGSNFLETGDRTNIRLKLDYTKPFNKLSKLETGLQSRIDDSDSEVATEVLDPNNVNSIIWIDSPADYNSIGFKRQIHAAYITYSNQLFGFQYLLGLRGEYTDRSITSKIDNTSSDFNRFDYYPTVHITKKLPADQQVQASYSKRVRRPRDWSLDPKQRLINDNTIRQGNPDLLPEITDAFELNYQKRLNRTFFSVEAYYRLGHDIMERKTTFLDVNNTPNDDTDDFTLYTNANAAEDRAYGVEFMINTPITKWWSINASTNVFNYKIDGALDALEDNQAKNIWNYRINSTFSLKWGTKIQLSAMYRGASVTSTGKNDPFFFTNLAIRQNFMNNKLSMTFKVRDLMGTMGHARSTSTTTILEEMDMSMDPRIVSLTLSYKLNNYKKKKSRNGDDSEGGDEMF